MILYHGTTEDVQHHIINGDMMPETWLSCKASHAYRLAEDRSIKRLSPAVVIKLNVNSRDVDRVMSRKMPTYKFTGGRYKAISIMRMAEDVL